MRNILFILLFAATFAYGQRNAILTGRVMQDGRPEAKAVVRLQSNSDRGVSYTAVADNEGYFKFENVQPGSYTVSSDGAANTGRAIAVGATEDIRLRAGETAEVKLNLGIPPIRETVTISSGHGQPIEHISKSVDTVSPQEMRERADFALIESLRTIPGFRVQQLGGFGRAASIKTRGLRTQDTAVLIDGIRMRDPAAITGDASPFLGDLTLTNVAEVEVLTGSGSSLYGTNAIGGVIDLKSPSARAGTHGQFSAAFGGLGLSRFRGNVSNADGAGKFGISSALSHTEYSKGIDGQDDARNTNLQIRADSQLNDSFPTLSGRIFFSDAFVKLNGNPDTTGTLPPNNSAIIAALPFVNFLPDSNDSDDAQNSRFFSGQLSVNHYLRSDLVLDAYYQGLTTRRRNDTGPEGVGFQSPSTSVFDGSIHTAGATLAWSPGGVHRIKAGYEFEIEHLGNEGLTPDGLDNFFTKASQSSHTIFAQDVVGLLEDRLQIAGGFRSQFFDLGGPSFSIVNAPYADKNVNVPPSAYTFDAAVSYYFSGNGTKLRGHVGNGYRVPSLYERYGTFFSTFFAPEFIALGDPRLKPERSIAFDTGVEQYAAGQKVKLTAVYFYTQLSETIGFGNIVEDIGQTPRPFGGYINQKGGIARGGEFSATVKPTNSIDIFASYTFTNSDQREPQVLGTGVVDALGIPQHQFTLVATQRFKQFWINADLLLASDYLAPIFSNSTFNTYIYRFEGNRRLDLTAGYKMPLKRDKFSLRLFATVENVIDQDYFENGFRTAGRHGRIGLSFGF